MGRVGKVSKVLNPIHFQTQPATLFHLELLGERVRGFTRPPNEFEGNFFAHPPVLFPATATHSTPPIKPYRDKFIKVSIECHHFTISLIARQKWQTKISKK
ncbi:hypothetical protein BJI48_00855 [Helicobacter sp. 11S02596-1]|nr:hypothetical protein BJI48_00855 [Helicobacter sp. 11S02596-1]